MKEIKYNPSEENEEKSGDKHKKGNTPEIDIPAPSDASNVIPDEVPRRDGPGGE